LSIQQGNGPPPACGPPPLGLAYCKVIVVVTAPIGSGVDEMTCGSTSGP